MNSTTARMLGGPMDGQLRAFPANAAGEPTKIFRVQQFDSTERAFRAALSPPLTDSVPVKQTIYRLVSNPDIQGPRWLYVHESITGKDYDRG